MKPNTRQLPDFRKLKLKGTIYAQKLDVPTRIWLDGFPGVGQRLEWFAIEYDGFIRARHAGLYRMRLRSDDGSKLYIDDQLIIDNDGIHATHSEVGSVQMDTEKHRIRVEYFQGPRQYVALQLYCTAEGGTEHLFPDCDMGLETPDKPLVYSTFKPGRVLDGHSEAATPRVPCLPEFNLCTPDQTSVEKKGREFHIILPANLVWGASIPNAKHEEAEIMRSSGKICDLSVDPSIGCSEWQGPTPHCFLSKWNECYFEHAGADFLNSEEKPGALIQTTVGEVTRFSVNGRNRQIVTDRSGALVFKDVYGSYEFYVQLNDARH